MSRRSPRPVTRWRIVSAEESSGRRSLPEGRAGDGRRERLLLCRHGSACPRNRRRRPARTGRTPGGTPRGASLGPRRRGRRQTDAGLPDTARHTPQSLQKDADPRDAIVVRETGKFAVRVLLFQPSRGRGLRAGPGQSDRRAHRLQRGPGACRSRWSGGRRSPRAWRTGGSSSPRWTARCAAWRSTGRSGATGPTTWWASSASCGRSARRPPARGSRWRPPCRSARGSRSSAALTVAAAKALSLLAGRRLAPSQLVDVAYRAEHDQVGVRCGRMDQTIAAHARGGHGAALRDGERRDPAGAVRGAALGGGDRACRTS